MVMPERSEPKNEGDKTMKEDPEPKDAEELCALIRVKIEIYGLTQEDIDYLRKRAKEILHDK